MGQHKSHVQNPKMFMQWKYLEAPNMSQIYPNLDFRDTGLPLCAFSAAPVSFPNFRECLSDALRKPWGFWELWWISSVWFPACSKRTHREANVPNAGKNGLLMGLSWKSRFWPHHRPRLPLCAPNRMTGLGVWRQIQAGIYPGSSNACGAHAKFKSEDVQVFQK